MILVLIILFEAVVIVVLGFILNKAVMTIHKKDVEIMELESKKNDYDSALDELQDKMRIHKEVQDELEERFEEMEDYYELKEILASYTSFTHTEVGDKLDEVLEDNSKSDAAKRIGADDDIVKLVAEEVMGIDSDFEESEDDRNE